MSPIQPKTLFRAEIAYVYSVHTPPPSIKVAQMPLSIFFRAKCFGF